LALKLSDIHRINQSGKISAILAIESGQAIENNLNYLRSFYNLGVRIMTLTWKNTDWADASQDKMKHNGLTGFGKSVIKEMNKLGMIIDVSHSADKTVMDVLKASSDPIIASHSCAKAISDHPRNLSDKLIKDIAGSGGVLCVNFYSIHLDKRFRIEHNKKRNPDPPLFTKVIDHIEHIIKVGGIDAVGLGSDFDGKIIPPKGLEDASKIPKITEALLSRGYLEEEIVKIMGGNCLRVFGQVCGI
jgi:membrane dipeptidase